MSAIIQMAAAAAILSGGGQPGESLPDWLTGDWACREEMLAGGPLWRTENWQRDDWSGLTGVVRGGQARAGSALAEIALARILDGGEGPILSHAVSGGPVREYRAVDVGARAIVFDAADGEMPERIAYQRGSFRLSVTYSRRDGREAQTWRFARAGIRAGAPDC